MGADDAQIDLDGHRLKLTHLAKVLYPETGTTKSDVIAYYAEVAHAMIPLVRGRPVTRKRWPDGVAAGVFFAKNIDPGAPAWVPRAEIAHRSGSITYPLIDSPAVLAWLAQSAALELHVPQWKFDEAGMPGPPNRLVFDLDPGPNVELAECAEVAVHVRQRLDDAGVSVVPVTSGSKGIHLYAGLDGTLTSDQASDLALSVAQSIEKDFPSLVVSRMAKALRPGRIFIDWSQNSAAKTTIAPYSLRGRSRPTVAAPRTWDELSDPGLRQLEYQEVLTRLADGIDPMNAFPETPERPPDKLRTYRSKRSADRTPEPVPAGNGAPDAHNGLPENQARYGNDDTFVIQEHHATALHWDFRLERAGVLVSWALPKGIPVDSSHNRLAIQTEDHPLDYSDFAGVIPAGEYGGGRVTIWDSGRYETEKWRDDEVIVQLRGARATGRFALIRTKGSQWLIHRTKGQPDLPPVEALPAPEKRGSVGARAVGARATSAEPAPPSSLQPAPPSSLQPAPPSSLQPAATGSEPADLPTGLMPMLATPGRLGDLDEDWRFEGKWDGVRAIAEVVGGQISLRSRNDRVITVAYPELAELGALLVGHAAVLDGEIVALDSMGRSDFGLLQQRMKLTKAPEIDRVRDKVPVQFFVFDVLFIDGISLLGKVYDDRRQILGALALTGEHVKTPVALGGPAAKALDRSRDLGWEGIVAKRGDSVYLPGKRGSNWIKVKNWLTQEVVLVGWRPGNGRREGGIGSLLLAVPSGGAWQYVGRVGTGFTDAMLGDLAADLKPLARELSPLAEDISAVEAREARWVRPRLVGEVSFAGWTSDGLLRQASWRGLRPDKLAEEVVLESR